MMRRPEGTRQLKVKKLIGLVVVSLLLASVSCAAPAYTDAEETISTSVGEEFAIALYSNPRLGFNWYETHNEKMFALVESSFVAKDKLSPVDGTRYFHFKTLKAGKTEITVTCRHGATGPIREQKVFTVDIK